MQETSTAPEVAPSSHSAFGSDDASDWGELETPAAPQRRSSGERRVVSAPHRPSIDHSSAPPEVVRSSQARSLQAALSTSAPPAEKTGEAMGQFDTPAAHHPEASARPLRAFDKTPPATERSPAPARPAATATSLNAPPRQRTVSPQDMTQRPPGEVRPFSPVTPTSSHLATSASQADAEQEGHRVVFQPLPPPVASAVAPSASAREVTPKAPSTSPAETPKLTIGRIEVEVVVPPARQERAASSPPARTLSRDYFDAIGLAQM